ncbi:MAG: hypothetical protein IPL54_08780 [Chitinophagaceae bacterium]|nr:hypothetical protein [Chitinophagaceae bacterium]
MKRIFFSFLLVMMLISFNQVIAQPKKITFCEGMQLVQKAFQDGKVDELKGSVSTDNKYNFNSKIDIDEVHDEFVGTNIGTYYRLTYKATNSALEQDKFMNELVGKLEQCFNKKAKQSKINGYKVIVGKVVFSAMQLGSKAIILSISDDE